MPSPFPGMDPFIEAQEWEDFHTTFITVMREQLSPGLRPRYLVRVERRDYVEHRDDPDAELVVRIGDVTVVSGDLDAVLSGGGAATATTVGPVVCELAMPQERRETYLVIRERETEEVVTIIETLSPSNKRKGGDGWREYLSKRDEVISCQTNLVELDLLRGGTRMPVFPSRRRKTPVPAGDYYAIISPARRRPNVDVYAWTLAQPLPTVRIPLLPEDDAVSLNLQEVFSTVYDRAAYDLSLNYGATLDPPLPEPFVRMVEPLARRRR
ncbi:MAG: DUF4058 family protein [Planctomycetaceae bacterium]